MKTSRLGRGLASLIREVPKEEPTYSPSLAILWPVEYPTALSTSIARLMAREALEKLSTRPRLGLKAARAYLDKLRQVEGRTHVSLDLPLGVDLTSTTMLQLKRERITNATRYQFFGVSIWK